MGKYFGIVKNRDGEWSFGIKFGYTYFSGLHLEISLLKFKLIVGRYLTFEDYLDYRKKRGLRSMINQRYGAPRPLGGDFDGDKVTMNIPHDDILSNIKPYSKKEE